jgi:hypothetical protein
MSRFSIPKSQHNGFKSILTIDEEIFSQILGRMELFKVGGTHEEFRDLFQNLKHSEISEISSTIFSFGALLNNSSLSYDVLSKELLESFQTEFEPPLELDIDQSLERLTQIFTSSGNIKLTFKALELYTNVQNAYRDSSLITDIRIVFNDDLSTAERHAIITHQLQLTYNDGADDKQLFLGVDEVDLLKLKGQIERELEKHKLIGNDYRSSFNFINLNE